MVICFSVRTDVLNPKLTTTEVIINGTNYVIKREEEVYATDEKKEIDELKKQNKPVVPMAVYERLKAAGEV